MDPSLPPTSLTRAPSRRERRQMRRAARYSRFVALMRYALPAAAVILGLTLLVWPGVNTSAIRTLPPSTLGERAMTKLHYRGVNGRGDPLDVQAARAVQVGQMEDAVDLEDITATLTRREGGPVTLSARRGRYDQKKNHLSLEGSVHIVDDRGYDLVTDAAEIKLNDPAEAWGDGPVAGRGPQGAVRGTGFRVTEEGKTVVIRGRPRLDLQKGPAKP